MSIESGNEVFSALVTTPFSNLFQYDTRLRHRSTFNQANNIFKVEQMLERKGASLLRNSKQAHIIAGCGCNMSKVFNKPYNNNLSH